jgi:hypothetical protein
MGTQLVSRLSSNMANRKGPPQPWRQGSGEMESLEQILCSDSADSDFASLKPRMQQQLFSKLRTENARLLKVEEKWRQLTASCPRTDIQIYLDFPTIEPGDEEDERNSSNKEATFRNRWSYPIGDSDENENDGGEGRGLEGLEGLEVSRNISWESGNLVADSPDSELRLSRYSDGLDLLSFMGKMDNGFSSRVSSQLLLYRLTVMFGMPPPKKGDRYKSCWEVHLRHCDGASVLRFRDYKGGPSLGFNGTAEASADALKLLNFLVGESCRHTYDGIVAGTVA